MMLSSSLYLKRKSKVTAKQIVILLALVLTALAPIALQDRGTVPASKADRKITIITSHNETIRREFAEAFSEWWAEKNNGEKIYVNWLTPGGTAEVRKVIDSKFTNFDKNKLKDKKITNVGMDVYFGGGTYAFNNAKEKGYLTRLDVFSNKSYLFMEPTSGHASIPQKFLGETFYDINKQWVGTCLSHFGICYNTDVLKRLNIPAPKKWEDLTDARYFKNIALADPTKSGSVTKAFEMILQQQMQEHIKRNPTREPGETEKQFTRRIKNEGWKNGLKVIQMISANARYFTDSASKVPHDVASGNAAAGMCIDFYGRTYNERYKDEDGNSRIQFIVPEGGTSVSVDPVAVFRDAVHPDLAQGFVEFTLTTRGQMLWNAKVGSPLGPKHKALRRLPIHRDIYNQPKYLFHFSDPDDNPYENKTALTYKPELTKDALDALRVIIRVMAIDTHEELTEAWWAMIQSDFPRSVMAHHFHDLNKVSYTKALKDITQDLGAKDKMLLEKRQQSLASQFRASYRKVLQNAVKDPQP